MNVDVTALSAALGHSIWQGALIAALLAMALAVIPPSRAALRHVACLAALIAINVAFFVTYNGASAAIAHHGSIHAHALAAPPLSVDASSHRWVVGLWACGVAISALRLIGGCVQLQRYRRHATTLHDDAWNERLQRLAQRVGITRTIELFESARVDGPSAVGWLRPAVFVPLGWLASLPRDQVEAVLLHELAHIRRHDLWTQWLPRATETLFFFHPAVWWISARTRDERECSCDALAVSITGAPFAYADALASMAERRRHSVPLTLAAHGGPLMTRIQRLLQPERARTRALVPAILFLALAASAPLASQNVASSPDDDNPFVAAVGAQLPRDELLPSMATDTSCVACHVVSPHHAPTPNMPSDNPFEEQVKQATSPVNPFAKQPKTADSTSLDLTPEEWALLRRVLAKIEAKEDKVQPALPSNHMMIDVQNTRCSDCHISTSPGAYNGR